VIADLKVAIVRFVDDYQPGIVECEFFDANGIRHTLINKIPIFTEKNLWLDSQYPQPGSAQCEILDRLSDGVGRACVTIRLAGETSDGRSEFIVFANQISPA
jgi:hypothetical protein